MKKLLLSIFSIFLGLISFSSANYCGSYAAGGGLDVYYLSCEYIGSYGLYIIDAYDVGCYVTNSDDFSTDPIYSDFSLYYNDSYSSLYACCGEDSLEDGSWFTYQYYDSNSINDCIGLTGGGSSTPSDISVFYDYGHSSTTVSCNGDNSIYINGMASVSNQTTFTPFFNISYVDEDNQNLIESYNKDILYLENGQFKKTYTGDNLWILSVQNQGSSTPDIIFTGETLPVVVTGNSDNVFSNFGDNALSVLYGNIPGFITGGVILFLIFFIIRLFIPKNRR